jgi:hypothetical protein
VLIAPESCNMKAGKVQASTATGQSNNHQRNSTGVRHSSS